MLAKVVTNRWSWLTTVKESLASARASCGTRGDMRLMADWTERYQFQNYMKILAVKAPEDTWKNSGLNGNRTHDFRDTVAAL